MDFSLRHIEIFVTVAKFKSITKAAEELFMSQSAISMALSEFEKRIGVKVFDRVNKKFVLNNYGEKLFFKAQNILGMLEEFECMARGVEYSGKLSIGATQTIGNYVLPDVIVGFKRKYSDVKLFLTVQNTEHILRQLINFEIDIAFIEGVVDSSSVEVVPWLEDEIILFSSPNHYLAKKDKVSLRDLKDVKWILREEGSGTRDIFQREIYKKLENINIYLEIGHTEAIKKIVESGLGIGCLSVLTVKRELEIGLLNRLSPPFRVIRNFQIVLHKKKYKTLLLEKFISFSKSYCKC